MTRDILEIDEHTILVEQAEAKEIVIDKCTFDEAIIGIAFYGSGNVELSVCHGEQNHRYENTKGFAMSFYANEQVAFLHKVAPDTPLRCLVILSKIERLKQLPSEEGAIFCTLLEELVYPKDNFIEGPCFYMTPEMEGAVDKFFKTRYEGITRTLFLRSQVTELLSHFFGYISEYQPGKESTKVKDRDKIYQAKDILTQNIEQPPSLSELSKLVGLNSYKLKKNFKALFGIPVFKFLQNERLNKAHELLRGGGLTVQETAWEVGYESLSSFSNAFTKKFGFRPSEIKF